MQNASKPFKIALLSSVAVAIVTISYAFVSIEYHKQKQESFKMPYIATKKIAHATK